MTSVVEVTSFLRNFKEKMKFWDVLFRDDRNKNAQALIDLELRPIDRITVLETLDIKDYSEGPLTETLYKGADMWVFGKTVKKKEVYIKINSYIFFTSKAKPPESQICNRLQSKYLGVNKWVS